MKVWTALLEGCQYWSSIISDSDTAFWFGSHGVKTATAILDHSSIYLTGMLLQLWMVGNDRCLRSRQSKIHSKSQSRVQSMSQVQSPESSIATITVVSLLAWLTRHPTGTLLYVISTLSVTSLLLLATKACFLRGPLFQIATSIQSQFQSQSLPLTCRYCSYMNYIFWF